MTLPRCSEKFQELKEGNLRILQAPLLTQFSWLRHGFSTRPGGQSRFPEGTLNLGFTEHDSRQAVEVNRAAFFSALQMDGFSLVRLRQIHSYQIAVIDSSQQTRTIIQADAAVTQMPQLILPVLTADCVPLMVVNPTKRAIAVIHAGWRGTVNRIVEKTLAALCLHCGGTMDELTVAIGPSIHSCCYEVGEDVRRVFRDAIPQGEKYFSTYPSGIDATDERQSPRINPGKFYLDLVAAILDQLMLQGIEEHQITLDCYCTVCHPELFFSHRREAGRTGRMMAAIAMTD
jgi:YfiH family protein